MKKNHRSVRVTSSKHLATRPGFVLGRQAFARVSAVEGISVSGALEDDLKRLQDATPERRRAALTEKYGKR